VRALSQEVRLASQLGSRLRPVRPPRLRQMLSTDGAQTMDLLPLRQTTVMLEPRRFDLLLVCCE